jgi:hypothetical protein
MTTWSPNGWEVLLGAGWPYGWSGTRSGLDFHVEMLARELRLPFQVSFHHRYPNVPFIVTFFYSLYSLSLTAFIHYLLQPLFTISYNLYSLSLTTFIHYLLPCFSNLLSRELWLSSHLRPCFVVPGHLVHTVRWPPARLGAVVWAGSGPRSCCTVRRRL